MQNDPLSVRVRVVVSVGLPIRFIQTRHHQPFLYIDVFVFIFTSHRILQEHTGDVLSPAFGGSRVSQIRTRPSSEELANTLSLTGLTDKLYTASMCRNTFRVSLLREQQSSIHHVKRFVSGNTNTRQHTAERSLSMVRVSDIILPTSPHHEESPARRFLKNSKQTNSGS